MCSTLRAAPRLLSQATASICPCSRAADTSWSSRTARKRGLSWSGATSTRGILPLLTRFLAEQRCGQTTEAISLHAACHLFRSIPGAHSGDGVIVDDGARPPYGSASRVDAEGGWHDAGDYIKFVGTTAYALALELMALRDHGAALGLAGQELARELRWGLDWLLKMVAGPEPYHQVGGEGDHAADWRLPDGDTRAPLAAYDQRPVFRMARGQGRNLLGRSAAAFAFASQVYAADDPYARKLLVAARATYALAKARPGARRAPIPRTSTARRWGKTISCSPRRRSRG